MTLSHSKSKSLSNSLIVKLSLLIGTGLVLFIFESLIPRPLPWMKPGLAHVATLLALYSMGSRETFIVVIGRVLLGSLLLGSFFNPTFLLSITGALSATIIMVILKSRFSSIFSIFGISISGAVVHNLTQLLIVQILIVRKTEFFYLAPVMTLSAVFTGFVIAFVSYLILMKIGIINPLIEQNT